ncbi:MAG: glycosyltransferase family 39 protein [Alphaproteobacteria bacterium]|nr:glycosyltransferase family 39 protein [Alphaproteobacteria bacterium]
MILSGLTVGLEMLSCVGLGALALRLMGLQASIPSIERLSWTFALGFGLLSLLVFPLALLGWISQGHLILLLAGCAAGLPFLSHSFWLRPHLGGNPLSLFLAALLVLVLVLHLVGGLAPPADGDSMAYHFARIKQTALQGQLVFLPQAVEGAAPMMAHMTYLPAYILGGERAMTLWTTASGLMTSLFFYAVVRRWLTPPLSLLLTLILLTTPAVVFGTSSGQVEIRNAQFVMLSALAVMQSRSDRRWHWLVLAGLSAGFFAGSKVFGLLWVGAAGLTIIWRRDWLKAGTIFGLSALLSACPWYLWNVFEAGDPLFPMLYRILGMPDGPYWTAGHLNDLLTHLRATEQPAPPTLGWFLAYPFLATLKGFQVWESGRTGLGVFCLLALPFSLAGAWFRLARPGQSPLWTIAWLVLLFYALWFFFGTAQRIRHLLPLYPLLLLIMGVAAFHYANNLRPYKPLLGATLAVIAIQTGGLILFALSPLKYQLSNEPRSAFLERSISFYGIVPWINENLASSDRLLIDQRQLLYHLNIPYFFAHPLHQARIDLRPDQPNNPEARWREMQGLGITHALITPSLSQNGANSSIHRAFATFTESGCASLMHAEDGYTFASRTLSGLVKWQERLEIYRLTPLSCPIEANLQKLPDTATNSLIPNEESRK